MLNKVVALLAVVIYLLPIIFNWGDSEIRIHDQLDSYNVYEVLVNSGKTFQSGREVKINNIMNGLPRDCFPSGYNVVLWLIIIFGPTGGFFVNYLLVHLIGFAGMLLMLNHVINRNDKYHFNWLVAAAFSILPVNTLAGISLTGIPLVFYAFNNLMLKNKIFQSFIIILIYCLYSSLIHAGVFVMFFLGILFLYQLTKKKATIYFFAGLALMLIAFALIELNLIKSILFSRDYLSHRVDFSRNLTLNFNGVIGVGLLTILNGNYGSANYFGLPVMVLALGILIYAFIKKENSSHILLVTILIVLCGFFISILDWKKMDVVYQKFHFLDAFNLRRFHFLLSVFMFVLFSLCINFIISRNTMLIVPLALLVISICSFNFYLNKQYNLNPGRMSFNQFFSKPLFKQIDTYIAQPKDSYRIVNLGIEPTPSQCYGFYTLDSYQNNYPLSYKLQFRKVALEELSKNANGLNYFDHWGNRCTLPYRPGINDKNEPFISQLSINTPELKNMGGKYIFSAALIGNAALLNIKLLKTFSESASPYKIYLYEVL